MRIRQDDLKDAIHKPHKDRLETTMVDTTKKVTMYTITGREKYTDDSNNPILFEKTYEDMFEPSDPKDDAHELSCAKMVVRGGEAKYYLKQGPNGRLYNPFDIDEFNKTRQKEAAESWRFAVVNQIAFQTYLNFLRTKNTAWISNAEREVI